MTPDRKRLVASLGFNFIAKAPGLVMVFSILPMISKNLGTMIYGELLSALALGSAFTLPFGGINAVGRRILATAFGSRDSARQADAFVTTTACMAIAALLASLVMLFSTAMSWSKSAFIFVSLLPIISGFFNTFDNLRASFNEHYVTAIFQLLFQVIIYAVILHIGVVADGVITAGLVLQGPFLLASAATFVLLILQRPTLLRGKIAGIYRFGVPAISVMMADGCLSLAFNWSVFWLNRSGSAEMAGWVGTFMRLFQSFLSPLLLILFPVTTYVGMRWNSLTDQEKILLHRKLTMCGIAYGVAVGVTMAFVGPIYIDRLFTLTAHGDGLDTCAISLFLGAAIAQKSCSMFQYAVSEARLISWGTVFVSLFSVTVAAVASLWLTPVRSVDVAFATLGIGLPLLLVISQHAAKRGSY